MYIKSTEKVLYFNCFSTRKHMFKYNAIMLWGLDTLFCRTKIKVVVVVLISFECAVANRPDSLCSALITAECMSNRACAIQSTVPMDVGERGMIGSECS